MKKFNSFDSSLEAFFLFLLRAVIIGALIISLIGIVFLGLSSFNLRLADQAVDPIATVNEVKVKSIVNSFLINKLKEDEIPVSVKDEKSYTTPRQEKFKSNINEINKIFYNYYNNFDKSEYTEEAWSNKMPEVEFKNYFLKNIGNDQFSSCMTTSMCNLSDDYIEEYFKILSNMKLLAKTSLSDEGYVEIIKDEVKSNASYSATFGNFIKNTTVEYYKSSVGDLNKQILMNAEQLQRDAFEAQASRYKLLIALGCFFGLAFLLVIIKIERNLRR